jgi:hypothetical protein
MRPPIDHEAARPANTFTAVRVEINWLIPRLDQPFVEDVEHFQERHIRRNVVKLVVLKAALSVWASLTPDAQFDAHSVMAGALKCRCDDHASVPYPRLSYL